MGALAVCLATGAAGSLMLFPILVMQEQLGTGGLVGWAIAVLIAGVVAAMTTNPLYPEKRLIVALVGAVVCPIVLIVAGMTEIGWSMLGVGVICCMFVMPMVEWACGLSYSQDTKTSLFQFSTGRDAQSPIASTLILGVLVFAWPGDLLTAGWVAAPFFGFLIMLASLGGMFSRVRESSSGVIGVHPRFLGQWFLTGLVATILCTALGFLLPYAMGNVNGLADRKLGGPVSGGPYATQHRNVQQQEPRPDYTRRNPGGLGDQQYQKDMPKPNQPQEKPPMSPEEIKAKLFTLLGLALAAGIAMWLLKKYNKQIVAFLRYLWSLISGPFIRAWTNMKENKRRKKHEAAVRAILASIEDPYSDPPASLQTEDLGPLYDKLVADLALIGARPRQEESALAFVRRVATVYSVDKESLFYLGQVMTEAAFSPRALQETKLTNARERFLKVRGQVHGSVPPQQLSEKQQAYRWNDAESRLQNETVSP